MGKKEQLEWINGWLDPVVSGESTMLQRKLTSLEKKGGGIDAVRQLASARGVHLLQLTDDKDEVLVAASMNAFKILS